MDGGCKVSAAQGSAKARATVITGLRKVLKRAEQTTKGRRLTLSGLPRGFLVPRY